MTGATLIVERSPGEIRAALLRGKQVWQVEHFRDRSPALLGGIYRGRVRRVDPAMNAAFVDIGVGADGFLRARDAAGEEVSGRRARIDQLVQEGAALVVGVVAEGFAGKGPRLARLSDEELAELAPGADGQPVPACLVPSPSPLDRILGAATAGDIGRIVCNDGALEAAARTWRAEAGDEGVRIQRDAGALFEAYGVEEAIAHALAPRVTVDAGAELVFEHTESLCAIDVNSARQPGKAGRGARDVNLAVASEIARQVRLRGIAGAIVIDALKMTRGDDKAQVLATLRRHLKDDPASCHVLGISNLGLIEMTRTRLGPSLAERLLAPAAPRAWRADAGAYAALRTLVAAARRQPAATYELRAAPAVTELLAGEMKNLFDATAARVGVVALAAQPGWPSDRCEVVPRASAGRSAGA